MLPSLGKTSELGLSENILQVTKVTHLRWLLGKPSSDVAPGRVAPRPSHSNATDSRVPSAVVQGSTCKSDQPRYLRLELRISRQIWHTCDNGLEIWNAWEKCTWHEQQGATSFMYATSVLYSTLARLLSLRWRLKLIWNSFTDSPLYIYVYIYWLRWRLKLIWNSFTDSPLYIYIYRGFTGIYI